LEDFSLHDKRKENVQLDYDFFFDANQKPPAAISHETLEAALTTAGGLALMIPTVGPALFALSVATFLLHEAGKDAPPLPDNVKPIEDDLFQHFKEYQLNDISGVLDTLKRIIRARAQEGLFEKTD
jgi:hypothetical protein